MNYLLTGAEFNNKGAEAMTLIALKNIYENDTNGNVFLLDSRYYPPFDFYKKITYIPLRNFQILCNKKRIQSYSAILKDFIKFFIPGKKSYFGTLHTTKRLLGEIDIVIDVSGFAFSSKWGDEGAIDWLSQIELMEKMGAKIWLMPQSFGPFDFNSKKVLEYGKTVLEKCEIIYAREESGFQLLKNIGLKNIKRMSDSVLSEKDFTPSTLIKNIEKLIETINIKNKHNIAIIPNYRLIDIGGIDYEKMLNFYTDIIKKYSDKYHFYLIAHAGEDLAVCKKIKKRFEDSKTVFLIDHVMFSFNFEEFSKKMDFIIASRYHSIIHAYKKSVPAIVLGWADKYKGIVSEIGQTEYLIDLNNYEKALSTVERMTKLYENESIKIKEKVEQIQEYSCYGFLKQLKRSK